MRRLFIMPWLIAATLALGAAPALAQVRTIDPDQAIDSDLAPPPGQSQPAQSADPDAYPSSDPAQNGYPDPDAYPQSTPQDDAVQNDPMAQTPPSVQSTATTEASETYKRDDLIGAAEGVFGRGAEGLAGIIESILKDQGEPNAYIAGREASGAFVVGLRYGSGILSHKVEGQQPVYWTGPSIGFDVGGDANKVFVLVYNLYDTEELFKRFPAGEGHLYFVGGFSASYLRSGNTVLIPVRLGVGVRAGVNVGYMKFTHELKWLPF